MDKSVQLLKEKIEKKRLKILRKQFNELMKQQSEAAKMESRRAHFKILAGAEIVKLLGINLDFYAKLPRPDRRKKGEQPEHPDSIFLLDLKAALFNAFKAGQPPKV